MALLDTDFISKTHIVQIDGTHHLADLAIDMPNYTYCCHQMTVVELSRHGVDRSPQWLQSQISNGKIKCYTDKDILEELKLFYDNPQNTYLGYLKKSCEAFENGYFETHFSPLIALPIGATDAVFLQTLEQCDAAIGAQQSLGEKKALSYYNFSSSNSPVMCMCSVLMTVAPAKAL